MTKKLLNKTLNYYMLFSLGVLLLGIPFFFFTTRWLYFHEIDETLVVQKKEFVKFYAPKLKDDEIALFNKLNRDLQIEAIGAISKDTFYNKNFYNNLENEPYRVLNAPVTITGKPYTFSAKINLVDNSDLIISTVIVFTVVILFLLTGLFIITRRLSTTLWKPFYQTLEQIEQFEIDKNSNPQFAGNDIDEFNRLNTALNKLIERNTLIYKSQKEFVENAAHELQTPIAIFKAKLETLIQRPDITHGQMEVLGKLNDTTSRLTRLNKNLLLLSKIESKEYNLPEDIFLIDVIKSQLSFFKEQSMAKNIQIKTSVKKNIQLYTNSFLTEIMIKNLFLNAINHNIKNGIVEINLDENSLVFLNTGEQKPLNPENLFGRFSKANPSSIGNGLGLSIIKRIVENNNWEISYAFEKGMHIFEIRF
ncbi:MAG: HAMP domain-containing sensor histidine kinase [Flavobacterium sp.]